MINADAMITTQKSLKLFGMAGTIADMAAQTINPKSEREGNWKKNIFVGHNLAIWTGQFSMQIPGQI